MNGPNTSKRGNNLIHRFSGKAPNIEAKYHSPHEQWAARETQRLHRRFIYELFMLSESKWSYVRSRFFFLQAKNQECSKHMPNDEEARTGTTRGERLFLVNACKGALCARGTFDTVSSRCFVPWMCATQVNCLLITNLYPIKINLMLRQWYRHGSRLLNSMKNDFFIFQTYDNNDSIEREGNWY